MEKEEGSGTILVTAICALALICLLVIVFAGAFYSAKARLDAIADLGALAGADASATAQWEDVGSRPCELAGDVVARNDADLESCEVVESDTRIVVRQSVVVMNIPVTLRSRARAGPVNE
ncbi:Rv3654c family TadE-like protein [Schaalia turicensis]|uniref:Rv3654c family TadE-like protein n=1 Tax=Schaalia turicensis TaxID=131111 RepID=UPI0034A3E270